MKSNNTENIISRREWNNIINAVLASVILFGLSACSSGDTTDGTIGSRVKDVLTSDSLPQEVKDLVSCIDSDDSASFAKQMAYPIARPYPLHDIENEEQMEKYYNRIVDDSLKKIIRQSGPEDWEEYGWRGWSVRNGEYIWMDGQVYDIAYISEKERRDIDSLSKKEIESLHPSMRGDWTPVGCLVSRDLNKIYRIDAKKYKGKNDQNKKDSLRLSIYGRKIRHEVLPEEVMTGHQESEGSASVTIYYFSGPKGDRIYYNTDVTDDSRPAIYYTDTQGTEQRVEVDDGYWLDILEQETAAEYTETTGMTPHSDSTRPVKDNDSVATVGSATENTKTDNNGKHNRDAGNREKQATKPRKE